MLPLPPERHGLNKPPGPKPAPDWNEETGTLAKWVTGITTADLPSAPFEIAQARTVTNPGQWLTAIKADIARGPEGARARTGTLQEDMYRLRRMIAK